MPPVTHPINRIDVIRSDAPELAAYGMHAIGVRTVTLVNPDQLNILSIDPAAAPSDPLPRYDRPLTVEYWYPAQPGAAGSTALKTLIRDGKTEVDLHGRAVRDAAPVTGEGPFPLVIVSHGYPGSRHLLSPLAENLASKGYVVAAIEHTDTTYDTVKHPLSFASALVNRPLDQLFVLDATAKLGRDPDSFLHRLVDADNTAVIGYSMGGYGVTVTAGAGVTRKAVEAKSGMWSAPHGVLAVHQSGSASHAAHFDPRVKTVVAFAPAGLAFGVFDTETLKGIKVPMLIACGSDDDIVGYGNGARATWTAATRVDRALLTFDNANHNAGPVMPAPAEIGQIDEAQGTVYGDHYIDAVWDNTRMNNISQHFVTAWLGKHLKADAAMDAYLTLTPKSGDGIWAVGPVGARLPEHTYWEGFPNRTAKGLRFETLKAGE